MCNISKDSTLWFDEGVRELVNEKEKCIAKAASNAHTLVTHIRGKSSLVHLAVAQTTAVSAGATLFDRKTKNRILLYTSVHKWNKRSKYHGLPYRTENSSAIRPKTMYIWFYSQKPSLIRNTFRTRSSLLHS